MKNTRVLAVSLIALLASVAMGGASTGNCEKKAASLKSQQNVSLVNCWDPDPEFGGYMDYGCYYYKVKLSKGESFSIWLTGGDSEEMQMSVYPKESEDDFFMTSFEEDSTDDGSIQYARLTGSDWDEEDPSELTFIIEITGEIGAQATLYSESGYKTFVPLGMEDNPDTITFSEGQKELAATFVNGGEYWLKAQLRKGRMYRVRTAGGSGSGQYTFEEVLADDEQSVDLEVYNDPFYASDTNNAAFVFSPLRDGTYTFLVSNIAGGDTSFSLFYEMLKAKTPSQHDVLALDAGNGYSTTFVPGRRVASWDFADNIIDEHLASITLAKGDRYVFETSGATEGLHMVVYDTKGNILAENRTKDGVGKDVRTVLEADAAGTYYVGVCNDMLEPYADVTGDAVTLTAARADAHAGDPDEWDALDDTADGATGLEFLPGTAESSPLTAGATHGPHRLSKTDWVDTFAIAARKDITYRVGFEFADSADTTPLHLAVEVFRLSGTRETVIATDEIDPSGNGYFEFSATDNQAYYVRCRVAEGTGLDFPGYNVRTVAYSTGGEGLGILTVNTFGTTEGAWSLDRETVKYPGGSSVLLSGTHTVNFNAVKGFSTPAAKTVTVTPGTEPTVINVDYTDTFDPKDDTERGATALRISNKESVAARTLMSSDEADHFSFTGADGCYYDFELRNNTGDAVFSIVNDEIGTVVENATSVSQLPLGKTTAKYYLVVTHGTAEKEAGSYTLAASYAKVGAIKFAKTSVSAQENAASVKLTVNRTAKDGVVRVKYGTVAGTAQPGVDYVAQNGVLEWADGDNKAKTIEVRLIPDLVDYYEGNKSFSVQLKALEAEERTSGEYAAQIVNGDTCTVTLTETARAGTTVESAYAAKAPKMATTRTEDVALSTGTFYGVIGEDGFALESGFPALASVTLTVSTKTPAALSAKVALGGKTYTFKGNGWDEVADGVCTKTLELVQKTAGVSYVNTLTVRVADGATATAGDWLNAGADVELVMNVPSADNKSVQEDVFYAGRIFRDNAKIQDYLTVVTNFTGYYTVALAPQGVTAADGVPAGNGYVTLTIDNKGTVKIAGMLPDGKTKPSGSVKACALVPDTSSANGYSLYVPVFTAKKPACFGGTLRLYADASGSVVVDSTRPLPWYNDDVNASYYGDAGFKISYDPVGGWYDNILNLQAYYRDHALSVGTVDVTEFPAELVTAGYQLITDVQPSGTPVTVNGNAFAADKKTLVRDGRLNDLVASINPCGVQVKLARATGLVSGSFSVWTENETGSQQKEIKNFKHYGVLVLAREADTSLDPAVTSAGFCTAAVTVKYVDEKTNREKSRKWTFSAPFNVMAEYLGDRDAWADDWGDPAE